MGEMDMGRANWEFEIKARERCVSIDGFEMEGTGDRVVMTIGLYRSMYEVRINNGDGMIRDSR